jgi:hypothetical protein
MAIGEFRLMREVGWPEFVAFLAGDDTANTIHWSADELRGGLSHDSYLKQLDVFRLDGRYRSPPLLSLPDVTAFVGCAPLDVEAAGFPVAVPVGPGWGWAAVEDLAAVTWRNYWGVLSYPLVYCRRDKCPPAPI